MEKKTCVICGVTLIVENIPDEQDYICPKCSMFQDEYDDLDEEGDRNE